MLLPLLACHLAGAPIVPAPDAPASDRVVDTAADTDTDTDTDTGPLGEGDVCDPEADRCDAGLRCCTPCCVEGYPSVCTALDIYGGCPLPDITIDAATAADGMVVTRETFDADDCGVVEGCLLADGERTLVRFNTITPNYGTADFVLGDPAMSPSLFQWSECHQHWHVRDFADYALYASDGSVAATGHKQGFCLMDAAPWGSDAPPVYTCAFQGISVGWADVYAGSLDCQWIDVTGVPAGDYTLRITVDPLGLFPDRDESNDVVSLPVALP